MADPVRHSDLEIFIERAERARADAEAATLGNVRDRCLRAEAAWLGMAARVERADKMRADLLEAKRQLAEAAEKLD